MTIIDIGPVHPSRPHLFADAIETLILFGGQSPFSQTDAFSLMNQSPTSAEDVIGSLEDDRDDDDHPDDISTSEITKNKQKKIDEAFAQFQFRARAFGEAYPFRIDENQNLSLNADLAGGMITYAFLLGCSRLRSFGNARARTYMADCFEDLCAISLEGVLAPHAEIIRFGPTSDQRAELGTSMKKAIPALAARIGATVSQHWHADEETPQGDGGIDLIAIVPLDDQPNKVSEKWTLVGQCAACERSGDWEHKIMSAYRGLTKRMKFRHQPSNALFIPGAYRKTDGGLPDSTKDEGVLLMDRVRIMHNIRDFTRTDELCWGWLEVAEGLAVDLSQLVAMREKAIVVEPELSAMPA